MKIINKMEKIAIVGGGISGLSMGQILKENFSVKIFEKDSKPGGLIKCDIVDGFLYHMVGGHVFNSRRQDVLDWFWNFFDRDNEFVKADRNAVVFMENGNAVKYPIENHVYMMGKQVMDSFVEDLIHLVKQNSDSPSNFEEFLQNRFGETLYNNYFRPYNEKIWRKDLKQVPLSWLEGKLPMPTIKEIILNNIDHVDETGMVHSTFFYAKEKGSQFLVDRLATGINIQYNSTIKELKNADNGNWLVNGETFDKVIFCGNIKNIPDLIKGVDIQSFAPYIQKLDYHGTTSVLCEINKNPYSWIYLPSKDYLSHRIICTGNFSENNNPSGKMSGTIEFTDYISKEDIDSNLKLMPLQPKYITHKYTEFTYPIQDLETRDMITALKKVLEPSGFYLLGRFAEWEYYNMDAAIGAALDLANGKFFN